ncbi:MAG: hypothetical protein K1X54_06490 [Flavobacteriales bacterium]|nr:hypothetical protein [Flavobacteriales bacterium]
MKRENNIRIHGHRGWRGKYPENSIVAFTEAVRLGVDVLEMDVVLSSDLELMVSHDPFMHHEICRRPDGHSIAESEELSHNLYRMKRDEIQRYLIGGKAHPRFPDQLNATTYKPTFHEVVDAVHPLLTDAQRAAIHWNVEIKSRPEWDHIFHPEPAMYATVAYEQLKKTGVMEFTVIQSFDARILKELYHIDPSIKLIFLNEWENFDVQRLTDMLGFKPYGYSPYYPFVNEKLLGWCADEHIQLITWTVNEEADIRHLLSLGVKEIISDYPERVLNIASNLQ